MISERYYWPYIVNALALFIYVVPMVLAGHALDDDVVPVKGDHGHGPDGHAAGEGPDEAVQLAHERPERPGLVEVGNGHEREHGGHHEEVRESCIHENRTNISIEL